MTDETPSGIRRRGEAWLLDYRVCGKRVRRHVPDMPLDEARALRDRLISEGNRLHPWNTTVRRATIAAVRGMPWENPTRWMDTYLRKARANAAARGIPFDLSADDAVRLLVETGGKCSVSGALFSDERIEGCRIAPYRPSLDRIDSRQGYTALNCRWVCAAMNVALNDFGESVFKTMAIGYVERLMRAL